MHACKCCVCMHSVYKYNLLNTFVLVVCIAFKADLDVLNHHLKGPSLGKTNFYFSQKFCFTSFL